MFALAGIALVSRLIVKLNPAVDHEALTVSYTFTDAAPQVVEHQVTSVLEGAFATISGIQHIESVSSHGYGYITLEAEKKTDLQTMRFQVLSVIKDVWQHLPDGVGYPEIITGSNGKDERQLLLSYVLNGNVETLELQQYAEKHIQTLLSGLPGTSGVEVYGATPYEWNLNFYSAKLSQYGLCTSDLSEALAQWGQVENIGSVVDQNQNVFPVTCTFNAGDHSEASWLNIPLKNINGNIIRMSDVADRTIVQQTPRHYFRINGLNTVVINIYASVTANQIALADQLYQTESLIKKDLPANWSLLKMYDSSEYLRREITKTTQRILAAIVLLLLLVLLVHRSFRYLLLIAISLVINLAIAVIFYHIFRVEIHLVSIAGITVSISIIIDNYIMMADHVLQRRNLRIFTAMMASTLTTLGALVVIFFLDESDKINLVDFAQVVIINLAVSLPVALWLIPSLINGLNIKPRQPISKSRRFKRVQQFNRIYSAYIKFARRWRWALIIILILAFGSSLKLFMQHTRQGGDFYSPSGETTLYIRVSLPTGTTTAQLNEVCLKMEGYLQQFPAIRQFQTSVNGPQDATIVVYFTPESEKGSEPGIIKNFMIQKATEFAGADFGIYMRNESFSNELSEGWRMSSICMSGYNYRELLALSQSLSDSLLKNPRIENIAIYSGLHSFYQTSTIEEKGLLIDKARLAAVGIGYADFVNSLYNYNAGPVSQITINDGKEYITVKLIADDLQQSDLWQLMNTRLQINHSVIRPGEVSQLTTINVDGNIYKKDQSYYITTAYDFIGPEELSRRVLEREKDKLNKVLPLGYKAEIINYQYSWSIHDKPAYYRLLILIAIIIWAISAVMFESLIQPLVVISAIPISFIGTFLTFYLFKIPFDEGGYASLLLLSGLAVNMVIYILNDINHFRKQKGIHSHTVYLKAFNFKIRPIMLTTASTVIGLLPFLVVDSGTSFWTAFAAGTTGGLLFAIPMITLYLPLMIRMDKAEEISNRNPLHLKQNQSKDS